MIRHIVMWKMKQELNQEEKENACQKIKTGLEGLRDVIPQIRDISVGINCNPKEIYDLVLYSVFDTLEDVKAYSAHEEHVKVAGFIQSVVESRCAVDYEWDCGE